MSEGWRTHLPCSEAAAAVGQERRTLAVPACLGKGRIGDPGAPGRMKRVKGLGGTHFPTSSRLPPVPRPRELLKVTNCFHY